MSSPSDEVIIRPVRVEDAEALTALSRQEGVIEHTLALPSDRGESRRQMLAELGPDEHWLVAEVFGTVVGLAGLTVGRGRERYSGHVFVFVGANHQGRGIGTQLLQALLDLADNWLLLRRVALTVMVTNEGAKRLYERLGFEVEGRLRQSVLAEGELVDEWIMARCR
jgi:L-phenylalanine/L-methionine N-acetyltransferase